MCPGNDVKTHTCGIHDKNTLYMIKVGDEVIKSVKKFIPFGSGNQEEGTKQQQLISYVRLRIARARFRRFIKSKEIDELRKKVVGAIFAGFEKGANCGETAALAFCQAVIKFNDDYLAMICESLEMDHGFVIVIHKSSINYLEKRKYEFLKEKMVVIDPWPIKAQAVLLKHFFVNKKFRKIKLLKCNKKNRDEIEKIYSFIKNYLKKNKNKNIDKLLFNKYAKGFRSGNIGKQYYHEYTGYNHQTGNEMLLKYQSKKEPKKKPKGIRAWTEKIMKSTQHQENVEKREALFKKLDQILRKK
ncbi:MAG: hypothetical protein GY839_11360 [candidate division Zixibacteria bacterium]|nr:hypothetical protein [candidate division Zixibacteria bacterium]